MAANPTSWPFCAEEILAVIAKHIKVDREKVSVKMDRGDQVSTLEVDIELPLTAKEARGVIAAALQSKTARKDQP